MMHYADTPVAVTDVGSPEAASPGLPSLASSGACFDGDLKDLARLLTPPTADQIRQIIVEAEALEAQQADDPMPDLRLPPLVPGQTCSIMDLKGCLAGFRSGPPLTTEEMREAAVGAVVASFWRGVA